MAEHIINFVEGDGVSIQAGQSVDGEMWDVEIATTVGTAADAADVSIADAGGYYTADNVEDALQEIGAAGSGGTSPADTAGWMPLTTVVGGAPDLVWDATNSLIPTYGPF